MSRCASHVELPYICRCLAALLMLAAAGCSTLGKGGKSDESEKKDEASSAKVEDKADAAFLLTMSYAEASAISPQKMTVPPFYKVAADEITVSSRRSDGQPKSIRAKGHVFVQIDYRDEVRALGQEALIEDDEVILRGRPLMKRGPSVIEGLDDRTVLYIRGLKLQVLGSHRLTSDGGVTPAWKGKWQDGPNPLLPALSPDDVPKEMRASPLLPALRQ